MDGIPITPWLMRCARPLTWLAGIAVCCMAASGCANCRLPRIDPSGDHIFAHDAPPYTTPGATPMPVPSVNPSADGLQPGISINPARVIQPVGSEVVMIATAMGADGRMMADERVEWTLDPAGTAKFVALGERGSLDFLNHLHGLPKKINSTFAINTTAAAPMLLDRGTPTPTDDVAIQTGQAWVSVSSPVEGTSHVTVFAPAVPAWDRRQQSATIYWVDAAFAYPSPAINPVGSRHTFTTTVTRHTDGEPLIGWVVRYEITGGPEAGFAPEGTNIVEVATNELGQGSAEIFQKQSTGGTNQVAIQVIRPPSAASDGQRLVVGTGATTKTWTSSNISIRTRGPAQVCVGDTITYRIEVCNPSALAVQNAVVSDEPPAALTFASSRPEANTSPSGQEWRLGEIGPGVTRVIDASFKVTQAGGFVYCASVSAGEGLSAKDCATTSAAVRGTPATPTTPSVPTPSTPDRPKLPSTPTTPTASKLQVEVTGPATAKVNDELTYTITVINRGDETASGLVITNRFDAGLEHERSSPIESDLEDIAPGRSRAIVVKFRVAKPGELCQEITVTGDGGIRAAARKCVRATAPADSVQPPTGGLGQPSTRQPAVNLNITAPSRRQVGQTAEFRIDVKNTGNVPLRNLKIDVNYSDSTLQPVASSEGLVMAPTFIGWNISSLEAGKSIRRQINCKCLKETTRAYIRATVTADGGVLVAEEAAVQIVANSSQPATEEEPDETNSTTRPSKPADEPGHLKVTIADQTDPVKVGGKTTYQIVITNQTNASDRDVAVNIRIPPEISAQMVAGLADPGRATISGWRIPPIKELRARESISFDLIATAEQAGTARVRVEATSQRQPQPTTAEETTEVLDTDE